MSVDLQDLSRRLFQTANQLWTNTSLRPDQYAQPVLALIALRQMEAKFDLVHAELAKTFTGRLKPTPPDYHARGAIFRLLDAASGTSAVPESGVTTTAGSNPATLGPVSWFGWSAVSSSRPDRARGVVHSRGQEWPQAIA